MGTSTSSERPVETQPDFGESSSAVLEAAEPFAIAVLSLPAAVRLRASNRLDYTLSQSCLSIPLFEISLS